MSENILSLTSYSEEKRTEAMHKYDIIQPYLSGNQLLRFIANEKSIPYRTLQLWVEKYAKHGLKGLIRKKRADAGSLKVDQKVQEEVKHLLLSLKRNTITSVHRKICTICNENNWAPPSYDQVYAMSKNVSPSMKKLAHEGRKEYQNHYDLIHRREAHYPNEIWQADHTPLDIFVLNEKGELDRPWLTVIMDEYSRSIAGYYITFDDPTAMHTALVLHQAIWRKNNPDWQICGIPETFYTDHGSDFTSNHLEQVAIDLKMSLVFSTVGVPRGRGKIERFFLSVNQLFLQDLPGYIGNRRPSSHMTLEELNEALFQFILYNYHHKIHSTTKQKPIEAWMRSGFLLNMPESLESLDLLLLNVAKPRKVHADGIRFQGLRYMNINLAAYVGETIIIRYDPRDLAEIRVFYQDNFLCTAISPDIANATVSLTDIVAARNKQRRRLKKGLPDNQTTLDHIQTTKQHENLTASPKSKLKRYRHE